MCMCLSVCLFSVFVARAIEIPTIWTRLELIFCFVFCFCQSVRLIRRSFFVIFRVFPFVSMEECSLCGVHTVHCEFRWMTFMFDAHIFSSGRWFRLPSYTHVLIWQTAVNGVNRVSSRRVQFSRMNWIILLLCTIIDATRSPPPPLRVLSPYNCIYVVMQMHRDPIEYSTRHPYTNRAKQWSNANETKVTRNSENVSTYSCISVFNDPIPNGKTTTSTTATRPLVKCVELRRILN